MNDKLSWRKFPEEQPVHGQMYFVCGWWSDGSGFAFDLDSLFWDGKFITDFPAEYDGGVDYFCILNLPEEIPRKKKPMNFISCAVADGQQPCLEDAKNHFWNREASGNGYRCMKCGVTAEFFGYKDPEMAVEPAREIPSATILGGHDE